MNPQSDINRFMMVSKALFVLLFVLSCTLVYVCLLSDSGLDTSFSPVFISILSVMIFITMMLFFLTSKLKSIPLKNHEDEKALLSSEQKYKSIVENIQIGFARSTPEDPGKYIEVNSFFAKTLGYSKEELMHMPVASLYEDRKKRKEFLDKISKSGHVHDEEVVFSKKDGAVITLSVTGKAVRDENNKIIFFDLILEDITRKKFRLEESIKNEKLSSIGTLAGGIAHDFNNILTGLYGNIALARLEIEPDTEAAQLIADAESSMSKATDLTQQLLVFAKGGDPIKETINIDQVIKEAAKFNLSGSNIKLVTHFEDQLMRVKADKGQINQVISNMVINARHAMPDGGILTIFGQNVQLADNEVASLCQGNYVKIVIQDNGIGISEQCISKIFDPYFTTKHTGSGMGLATVFSIIKKHSGWITVFSETGCGAIFQIYLPADPSEEDIMPMPDDIDSFPVESARILIMDDDEQVCAIAKKMITRFGFQSTVVSDGEQAVIAYQTAKNEQLPYDVVLMDLTIPGGMGGKEAVLKILEINPKAKAIVISGYSNDPVLANYQDYGFKGMLVKPFKIVELKNCLETVLKTNQ